MSFNLVKLLDPIQNTIITGGLIPKGAYDAATNYAVGDSVDYLGSSYVMFFDAPAATLPTNTTYWQVVANKGATGATGDAATNHTLLLNIGTNTHAQIDTHIANTSNPHSVTKAQIGLSAVPNTDFTADVAANTTKIAGIISTVGILKGNGTAISAAIAGTDYENPLTFSTGLTRATNTVTANLATGIAGGQSVIGGTATGENLTLSSTTHATKGKILFGTSAYDEVNHRLGVGIASPTARVHLYSTADTGARIETASGFSPSLDLARTSATSWRLTNTTGVLIIGYSTNDYATVSSYMSLDTNGLIISSGRTAGAISLGADVNAITRSSNTRKLAILTSPDYANTRTVEYFTFDSSTAAINAVSFGGRVGGSNYGATQLDFVTAANSSTTGGTLAMRITSTGTMGVGVASPSAVLHLKAGTAAAGTAPAKLSSGPVNSTAENGALEYNGTNFFFTRAGAVREGILTQSAVTTEALVSDTTVTVNIGGVTYKLLARA